MTNSDTNSLQSRFRQVTDRIADCCLQAGRDARDVRLVAVSKKHSVEKIQALADLGQQDFGENYLQEALQKIQKLEQSGTTTRNLTWHFIGHIQSRKCRNIAENFDWVHTVESVKVARRLSNFRGEQDNNTPLQVLIQVNIDDESSKSGVQPDQVAGLAREMMTLDHIELRGLMIIPRLESGADQQHLAFQRCRDLLTTLTQQLPVAGGAAPQLDQLSMGMSGDMPAAIAEGATMLRIGTALFGERPAD